MSSARQLINTVHVDMLIVRATKKTNNRLVLSTQYARRCEAFFYFSFPRHAAELQSAKIAIQLV